MLNSGKKFRALCDKKNKYSNSCVVRTKISERNKKPKPLPPFKLNGRSLSGSQSVQVFHYLFISVLSGNGIPFTGLTPPPFCSCPKADLDFQRRMSWSFCVVWVFLW